MTEYKGFKYEKDSSGDWILVLPNGYKRTLPANMFADEAALKTAIDGFSQ